MDCRTSLLVFLGLSLGAGGCVHTTEPVNRVGTTQPSAPAVPQPRLDETAKKKANVHVNMAAAKCMVDNANQLKPRNENERQAQLANYDLARKAYQDVLVIDPKHVPAYQGLARMYLKLHKMDQALDTLKKALALAPRDASVWFDLGMCRGCRKEWDEQIRCLQKAIELRPDSIPYSKSLGFALARSGRFSEAVAQLTLAYANNAAYAHYMVARMINSSFEHSGDAQCKQHLHEALRENPNLLEARDMLIALERPAGSPATSPAQAADVPRNDGQRTLTDSN